MLHRFHHHAPGSSAAKRFHHGNRQRIHESGINSKKTKEAAQSVHQEVECARSPEYPYGHKHGNQVRNDLDGNIESFLCSFNKGLIQVNPFPDPQNDKKNNDEEENKIACKSCPGCYFRLGKPAQIPDDSPDDKLKFRRDKQAQPYSTG